MSTQILHAPLDSPTHLAALRIYIRETRRRNSPYEREELAALRFSSFSPRGRLGRSPERRAELRADLVAATQYVDKIDEIAMTFGVAAGNESQGDVERDGHCAARYEAPRVLESEQAAQRIAFRKTGPRSRTDINDPSEMARIIPSSDIYCRP